MQIAGTGRRIAVEDLRSVLSESKSLAATLMRYAHVVYLQAVYTALANAEGAVDQRLAHDRVEGDDLHITHEFISIMLGVRRAGVTAALHELEARSQISAQLHHSSSWKETSARTVPPSSVITNRCPVCHTLCQPDVIVSV